MKKKKFEWEEAIDRSEGIYGVELSQYLWDEDAEEYEYDNDGSTFYEIINDGTWEKVGGPGAADLWDAPDVDGGNHVIGDVEIKWLDEMAPNLLIWAVEEELVDDYDFNFSGKSGRSEALYLKHPENTDVRIRIATHEPAYDSSYEAYNIIIGGRTAPTGYSQGYYLPVPATSAQISKATKAASEWADEQVEALSDEY